MHFIYFSSLSSEGIGILRDHQTFATGLKETNIFDKHISPTAICNTYGRETIFGKCLLFKSMVRVKNGNLSKIRIYLEISRKLGLAANPK